MPARGVLNVCSDDVTFSFASPGADQELDVSLGPAGAQLAGQLRLLDRDSLAEQVARGFGLVRVGHAEFEDLAAAAERVLEDGVAGDAARDSLIGIRATIARLLG